jgi:hypothetical protein
MSLSACQRKAELAYANIDVLPPPFILFALVSPSSAIRPVPLRSTITRPGSDRIGRYRSLHTFRLILKVHEILERRRP